MSGWSRAETLVLAACLLAFLFFTTAWILLPGPQQDELLHVVVVLPELRKDALHSLEVEGRQYPLMIMSYVGALKGWLLWLWFLIVPRGVAGYRAWGVVLGLLTVALIFVFIRRHWGRGIASLTTALVATDPSFVHTIRLDYGPVAVAHLCRIGGLCLVSRWLDTRSRSALAGAMFLFGLGLWDKATFAWFLAGAGAAVLLLFPREAARRALADPRAAALAVAALLAGAAPFLAYNLKHSGPTWRENAQFEIRWFKLVQARSTFDGQFMQAFTSEDQLDSSPPAAVSFPGLAGWMHRLGRFSRTIILPLLAAALLLLPLNLWIAGPGGRRRLLFPLLASLLIYASMFLTFDGGASAHHVVMLQPFPLLFLAASLWMPSSRWRLLAPVAGVAAAAALAVNLSINARHLAIYTRTGGTGRFTDAAYRLVPYLAQDHPRRALYALDWGFSNPVMFLGARWNLYVDDFFFFFTLNAPGAPGHREALARLAKLMRDPHNVFLLHSPQRTLYPAAAEVFFSLAEGGIPVRQVAFFQERSGEIVYQVYVGGASPRAGAPPEVAIEFSPGQVAPRQDYTIQVREFPNSSIDVVYQLDRSSGSATRFCRLDSEGRGRLTVPAEHPPGTVRITQIRRTGEEWRPARGAITVVKEAPQP